MSQPNGLTAEIAPAVDPAVTSQTAQTLPEGGAVQPKGPTQKDLDNLKSAKDREIAALRAELRETQRKTAELSDQAFQSWKQTASPDEVRRAETERQARAQQQQQFERAQLQWNLFTAETAAKSGYPNLEELRALPDAAAVAARVERWRAEQMIPKLREELKAELMRELQPQQPAAQPPAAAQPSTGLNMPTATATPSKPVYTSDAGKELARIMHEFTTGRMSQKDFRLRAAQLEEQIRANLPA